MTNNVDYVAPDFTVTVNPDLLDFGFDDDEEGAESFALQLNELVQTWIPYAQIACGLFARVEQRPLLIDGSGS